MAMLGLVDPFDAPAPFRNAGSTHTRPLLTRFWPDGSRTRVGRAVSVNATPRSWCRARLVALQLVANVRSAVHRMNDVERGGRNVDGARQPEVVFRAALGQSPSPCVMSPAADVSTSLDRRAVRDFTGFQFKRLTSRNPSHSTPPGRRMNADLRFQRAARVRHLDRRVQTFCSNRSSATTLLNWDLVVDEIGAHPIEQLLERGLRLRRRLRRDQGARRDERAAGLHGSCGTILAPVPKRRKLL